MRVFLIIISLFFFVSIAHAQVDMEVKLDFTVKNLSLDKALTRLSNRSKISIAYGDKLLPLDVRVTSRFKDKTFQYILEYLLRNSGLGYKIVGDQVVLYKVTHRSFTISGYVKDAKNGERLIASHVFISSATRGTITNEYGFYSLTLKEGDIKIHFSYLGYESKTKTLQLTKDQRLDVELEPVLLLSEILVLDDDSTHMRTLNLEQISLQMIKSMPSLGGEPDLFRAAQLTSGVQTGADGVGGIHVRGGNADQNLYLLDGVPIYNPSHLGGIFSIYDTDAIRSAQLMKDFIPTRYGGRLSSVLDVRTKEGNSKEWQGSVGVGLTSVKTSVEGPIKKNKGAIFFSGRRALLDFMVKPITRKLKEQRNADGYSNYVFYDWNAKVNYSLSSKDQLYLSAYNGRDNFYDENKSSFADQGGIEQFRLEENTQQQLHWGNKVAALRWNHLFNPKLFLNTTLTYSNYEFRSQDVGERLAIYPDRVPPDTLREVAFLVYESSIQDWAMKMDFDYVAGPNHYWRLGAEAIMHDFRPGIKRTEDPELFPGFDDTVPDTFSIPTQTAYEYVLYVEDQWTLFSKWKANAGIRGTLFRSDGFNRWMAMPRAQLWYELSPAIRLKTSFNYNYQYLHLLSSSTIGLPSDLWVPATARIKPQRSWQSLIGIEGEGVKGSKISLSVYYKKMDQLITYQEGTDFTDLDARNWEDKVTVGKGESYGAEFFLHKKIGKWIGWLNYTWSKTTRQFDEINLSRTFPFRYDRRHNGQVNILYNFSEHFRIAANWNYGTGLAISLPGGKYEFPLEGTLPRPPVEATIYDETNAQRMPAYHRLDVDLSYHVVRDWGAHQFNVGIYNVYSRKNPVYYRIGRDPDDFDKKTYIQATLFQILPYFSYRISF
jgi:outer membrane receptor for ferrienterochelin and colicin